MTTYTVKLHSHGPAVIEGDNQGGSFAENTEV